MPGQLLGWTLPLNFCFSENYVTELRLEKKCSTWKLKNFDRIKEFLSLAFLFLIIAFEGLDI